MGWFEAISACGIVLGISCGLYGCGDSSDRPKPRPAGTGNYVDYAKEGFKSVSWGPLWLLDPSCISAYSAKCGGPFANSDIAADWGAPMWSTANGGRGDLQNIKDLGANTVRLYGNDPRMNKKKFFDYADSLSLQVVEGLTGWVYNEGAGPNCASSIPKARQKSCYDAVYETYSQNLQNSFLDGSYYHNAISIINLANEPDFLGASVSPTGTGGIYMWAMISAFDAMLSAEQQNNVKPWKDGGLPKITCTWSFSKGEAGGTDTCHPTYGIKSQSECLPGIAFMLQFVRAIQDPETLVGYTPKNDLKGAFQSRWINTVQLFVPAHIAVSLFISPYMTFSELKDTPVVFTEWNPLTKDSKTAANDPVSLKSELDLLQSISRNSSTASFYGASLFQYQVAYQKDTSERKFGLFGLGNKVITQTQAWQVPGSEDAAHDINCLEKAKEEDINGMIASWGGKQPRAGLCEGSMQNEEVVVA